MPAWLISLIASLGIPALKAILMVLELRFPGIKPYVDALLKFLGGLSEQDQKEAIKVLHMHLAAEQMGRGNVA